MVQLEFLVNGATAADTVLLFLYLGARANEREAETGMSVPRHIGRATLALAVFEDIGELFVVFSLVDLRYAKRVQPVMFSHIPLRFDLINAELYRSISDKFHGVKRSGKFFHEGRQPVVRALKAAACGCPGTGQPSREKA